MSKLKRTLCFVLMLLVLASLFVIPASAEDAEIPLTCFGIVLKINSLMTAIILGITHASQPIFSYNFGAKKYDRVAELMIKGGN